MKHFLSSIFIVTLLLCTQSLKVSAADKATLTDTQRALADYGSEKEALAESVGTQAYLFGASIMTQYYFRNRMKTMLELSQLPDSRIKFNDAASDGFHFNELLHTQTKATHEMNIAGSPNVDTRYTAIFFNLEHGAQVLHVPPIDNRYFSINITDAYLGNRPYIGSRRGDVNGGRYLFTGPRFSDSVPAGVKQIKMPQNNFMVVIRIYVKDRFSDNNIVTAIQNRFELESLDKYNGTIEYDELHAVGSMPPVTGVAYFAKLVELMQKNPPEGHQDFIWNMFGQVGIERNKPFKIDDLEPAIIRGLESGLEKGRAIIQWRAAERGTQTDSGWFYSLGMGVDHDDYMLRSEWAVQGLTVGSPVEAMFFNIFKDSKGAEFDGSKKYFITIPKDKMPPVNEFWSITSYGKDFNLVPNPDYHYGVGSRNREMQFNSDGSLTFYVQNTVPEQGAGNWIPTPEHGAFKLLFRFYNPKPVMLDAKTLADYLPPVISGSD